MKQFKVRVGLGIIMCSLLSVSLLTNLATAASIQYSFTGTVDHVQNQLSSQFSTSQSMSGTMTVDPSGPINHPGIGTYTIQSFSLDIGSYHATMGTSGQVEIRDRLNGLDRFTATVNAPNGPNVNFLAPRLFEIQLRGPASAFGSDALPTTPPSVSSVLNTFDRWRLVFGPENGKVVRGEITALTAVPLPAAVILFGAGLVALVGLGAGSWRKRKNHLA
jgi:hypothetical protein